MPSIQSGQKLGEWNSALGKADITAGRRIGENYPTQREAHTAVVKSGEQGAIVRESNGAYSAYAVDDGSYADDLNIGESFRITHPAPGLFGSGAAVPVGQAQVVVDFIGEDGGSLTNGEIVAPPTGKANGQTVYFMRGLNSEGLRGKLEAAVMNAPNKALQIDEIANLQKLGYSVVIDNTATHQDLRNAFSDSTTAGVIYLGHGGGGELYAHDRNMFGPKDLAAGQVSPNLKMVYMQACQAGKKQQEWQQKFGPQTTVYSWDRNATNAEILLVNGGSGITALNPFTWKGETLQQTITKHLKDPGTTLSAPAQPAIPVQPALNVPASKAELQWAQQLEKQVSAGRQVTPMEISAYNNILARFQQQAAPTPKR